MKEDDEINLIMDEEDIKELMKDKADVEEVAKEKLDKRKKVYKKEQSFLKTLFRFTLVIITLIVASVGFAIYTLWAERTTGDEILFGKCYVQLGDTHVDGRRSFIRPYTEVSGMRYYNPKKIYEQIHIENHSPGLIVVSMTGNESEVTIFGDAQGLDVEIPLGERYLFVYEENSTIVEHKTLCN